MSDNELKKFQIEQKFSHKEQNMFANENCSTCGFVGPNMVLNGLMVFYGFLWQNLDFIGLVSLFLAVSNSFGLFFAVSSNKTSSRTRLKIFDYKKKDVFQLDDTKLQNSRIARICAPWHILFGHIDFLSLTVLK